MFLDYHKIPQNIETSLANSENFFLILSSIPDNILFFKTKN